MPMMLLWVTLFVGAALAAAMVREHRKVLAQRAELLDEADFVLAGFRKELADDLYPVVSGFLDDGSRVTLDVVSDTLVTRRLPQLWLRITVHSADRRQWPSIGVLARPTGAEYYSAVHGLAHLLEPPASTVPLLMRGDFACGQPHRSRLRESLAATVAEPKIKEAVISNCAIRVVIQAAQGERSAHLLFRQARFSAGAVPADVIRHGLSVAAMLRTAADLSTQPACMEALTA
jgi:hypothetical protein